MTAIDHSSETLAFGLALDVCEQWKRENGYQTISADDLAAVRKWIETSRAAISRFPKLRAMAAQGIDDLIARQHQADGPAAQPRRV